MAVVQVDRLVKTYKTLKAVDGLSFEVHAGEIFGIVGPNGAGKTTTIECVEGLREPTSGTIRVLDQDPAKDGLALRQRIGMQLQESALPDRIKVWEALLRLPLGRMATYSQLCSAIGHPGAAGAVGGAVNANPVAFLIPCHSVVPMLRQASCILSRASLPASYQGDAVRRAAIIGWESARADCATAGPAPTNGQYSQTKGAA